MATVDQRGKRRQQLNRRHQKLVIFTKRRLNAPLAARQTAGSFTGRNSGSLTEPKPADRRSKCSSAQPFANMRKIIVAGIRQRLRQAERRLAARVGTDNFEIFVGVFGLALPPHL